MHTPYNLPYVLQKGIHQILQRVRIPNSQEQEQTSRVDELNLLEVDQRVPSLMLQLLREQMRPCERVSYSYFSPPFTYNYLYYFECES